MASSSGPAYLTPKAVVSVKGDLVPAGVATFKKKVQGTTLSLQITDQTLRDPSSYNGYVVSASRTVGAVLVTSPRQRR